MPRKVKGRPPGELIEYVPAVDGNREQADLDDIVRVYIRVPTEAKRREVEGDGSVGSFAIDPKTNEVAKDDQGRPIVQIDLAGAARRTHRVVAAFVERVDNYVGADDQPITDGAALAEHGEDSIVGEVGDFIRRRMAIPEAMGKASGESSASGSSTQPSSISTASPASETDSPPNETAPAPIHTIRPSHATGG